MKILITGSDGVIARELRPMLDGNELMLVDKKSGFNLTDADMTPIIQFAPEVVFHLAASFERSDESPGFLRNNREDNIIATERLVQALSKTFELKSFIFASSYLTYNPILYQSVFPKPAYALNEYSGVRPRNLCGAAKLYSESLLEFLKEKYFPKMNLSHARIFRVYGKGSQDFISRSARWKLEEKPVQIWNEANSFDYIHARDVAAALVALFVKDANGIYNVATGQSTSIGRIADLIGFQKTKIENFEMFENSCGDIRKIRDEIGWAPSITIEKGIEEIKIWEEFLKVA